LLPGESRNARWNWGGGNEPLLSYHYNSQYSAVFKRGSFQHPETGLVHWQLLNARLGRTYWATSVRYTINHPFSQSSVFSHNHNWRTGSTAHLHILLPPHAKQCLWL